ncbi:hypothetical protein [Jeotgalibacillus marinus]|uniref:Uncharacterized protein n=1 Tax=Jeotgalibacillus marinus TaxID=86667 RepID=A0ABV3Q1W8_9BACL
MNMRKLDLVLSVVLLLNSIRIFYIIATSADPKPVDYMVLFLSTVGAVILFTNSRYRKNKEESTDNK